ncbi:neprilysin-1-like [Calliopsis andreniformis]|uniref:neprilysin-1-like n=1 Tax=Calliopsis andreniformis TaxID=337506 RepID=UPI003FCDF291
MLLLMLLGHLIPLTVLSDSSPIALISRTLDTVNNTEEDLKYVCHIKQDQGICETTYCKEIVLAKKLLKSMDTSVNPCDNFYDYACGSWKKYNPIPPHEVEWSEDHILTEKTYRRIIESCVLAEHEKPSDIMPVRMARKFYRSCMNIVEIEKDGINPILDILNSTGGWPMIMPGNMIHIKKLSWQNIDKQYLPLLRTSAFYLLGFEVDTNNTNQYVLTINRYTEGFLSKKKELFGPYKRYFFHIFNVIQTFAKEQDYVLSRIKMTNDVGKMLQFMYKLMKISEVDKKQQESDDNYERMTIQELQKWYDDSGVTAPTAKAKL